MRETMLVGRCGGGWSQSPRRWRELDGNGRKRVLAEHPRQLASRSSTGASNSVTCASWSGLLRLCTAFEENLVLANSGAFSAIAA
jgi:hypothetical protein